MIKVPFMERFFHMSCGAVLLTGINWIADNEGWLSWVVGLTGVVGSFWVSWAFREFKGE